MTALADNLMVRSLLAAAHIRALRCAGRSNAYITARADISHDQLRRAYRGDLIGWEVEQRILNLHHPDATALDTLMPSVGARRRLRALHYRGWPLDHLAATLGWALHRIDDVLTVDTMTVSDHLAVCALYDQRWMWTPEDHGITPEDADLARLSAEVGGYVGPLAWDDDTIDVATARPHGVYGGRDRYGAADHAAAHRALDGDHVDLSAQTRTLAITYGARYLDMPWHVMADRLGMRVDTLKRGWERIKRRERILSGGRPCWVDEPRFNVDAWHANATRKAAV
ncbi:MAG: hypothetical protein HOY79_33675 [Streptomyces sp.]|nr:hypothetical protein [Streptomyces sp.]NUS11357.1 hypothetical protein [Streptomyces sp.]NUS23502.1 hypothetical protein [Streptomyces sp.]